MISTDLRDEIIHRGDDPLYFLNNRRVQVLEARDGSKGIKIIFGTSMSLGGDHAGALELSGEELLLLLDACTSPPKGKVAQ